MAYIERETALKIIDNYANTVTEDGKVIVDAIRDIVAVIAPTADVVGVVRCKDCMWWSAELEECTANEDDDTLWNENDFCSYGERKENK